MNWIKIKKKMKKLKIKKNCKRIEPVNNDKDLESIANSLANIEIIEKIHPVKIDVTSKNNNLKNRT